MTERYRITVQQSGETYPCDADDTVLRAGLRAGIGLAYECNVGGCGSCKFELVEGEVRELWPEAPGLRERDRRRGRLLACQCQPAGDLVIKPLIVADEYRPKIPPRRFEAELTATRDLTHDIREFVFRGPHPAEFLPGQYALMELAGVTGARAYSMSNIANDEGLWEFIVREVPGGAGSRVLFHELGIGDRLRLDGPYGLAYLRTDVRRDIVCIGGGSGLAPLLSIARGLVHEPALDGVALDFFYGARGPQDVCGEAELRALPGFGERIRFHPAISMPELDTEGTWTGFKGFIHEYVKATIPAEELKQREFYLCGPPPMIEATMRMLAVEIRVPVSQIHYDSFF